MHPSDTINSNSPNTHLPPNTYRHQPSPTINTQSPPTTTSHHHNFFPLPGFPLPSLAGGVGSPPLPSLPLPSPGYSSRSGVFTYIYYRCITPLPGFFPYLVPGSPGGSRSPLFYWNGITNKPTYTAIHLAKSSNLARGIIDRINSNT